MESRPDLLVSVLAGVEDVEDSDVDADSVDDVVFFVSDAVDFVDGVDFVDSLITVCICGQKRILSATPSGAHMQYRAKHLRDVPESLDLWSGLALR